MNDVVILRELARQLGEIGVRVIVNAVDKNEFFPLIERGDSVMHLLGWACESGDAGDVLGALAHSATGGPLGSLNSLGLADPALDGLIDAADRARTDRERGRQLRLAVARVAELRAALPLVVQTEAVVLSRRLGRDPPLNMALPPRISGRRPEARSKLGWGVRARCGGAADAPPASPAGNVLHTNGLRGSIRPEGPAGP